MLSATFQHTPLHTPRTFSFRLFLRTGFLIMSWTERHGEIIHLRFSVCVFGGGWRCCCDSGCFSRVKAALPHSRQHSVTTATTGSKKTLHKSHSLTHTLSLSCMCVCVYLLTVFKACLNYKLLCSDATIWKLKHPSAYRKLHHEAYRHTDCVTCEQRRRRTRRDMIQI